MCRVVLVTNLKPTPLRKVKSFAMVLAASSEDDSKVILVKPPADSKVCCVCCLIVVGPHVSHALAAGRPDCRARLRRGVQEVSMYVNIYATHNTHTQHARTSTPARIVDVGVWSGDERVDVKKPKHAWHAVKDDLRSDADGRACYKGTWLMVLCVSMLMCVCVPRETLRQPERRHL